MCIISIYKFEQCSMNWMVFILKSCRKILKFASMIAADMFEWRIAFQHNLIEQLCIGIYIKFTFAK